MAELTKFDFLTRVTTPMGIFLFDRYYDSMEEAHMKQGRVT